MRGLKIIVLTDDAERFRGALSIAAAHVALGGGATLFLQLDAVRLLTGGDAPHDSAHRAAGLPDLAQLIEEALSLGVALSACQSGMALAGIDAATLDPRIIASGPVQFLQQCEDSERLIFA